MFDEKLRSLIHADDHFQPPDTSHEQSNSVKTRAATVRIKGTYTASEQISCSSSNCHVKLASSVLARTLEVSDAFVQLYVEALALDEKLLKMIYPRTTN